MSRAYKIPEEKVLGKTPQSVIPEIKIRFYRSGRKRFPGTIKSSEDVANFIRKLYKRGELELQEHFFALYLNTSNKIIGYYHHSIGGINSTLVDIRLILAGALKSNSVAIILAHNHPGGSPNPSKADKVLTEKIIEGAKVMDIEILDHIIITKDHHFSFLDKGLLGIEEDNKSKGKTDLDKLLNTVIQGDAVEVIKTFPDESIDCVITSPPYWQLRDYGWKGQWGLEDTYRQYLEKLWRLMQEIRRVLKPEGTVWINLGDSYFGSGNGSGKSADDPAQTIRKQKVGELTPMKANNHKGNRLPHKCLAMIPHRFATGCIDKGWIVRNDIIWAKPNGLPESVKDRFSKRHEHIFLLVKQADYYFNMDSIRDPHKIASVERIKYKMTAFGGDPKNKKGSLGKGAKGGGKLTKVKLNPLGKNPGDVTDFWTVSTKPGSEKHYATFNGELITKPILAGCPEGGIVLDPFCGTATTGVRAIELGRNFIGIEGKREYCKMAQKNIDDAMNDKKSEVKTLLKELNDLNFNTAPLSILKKEAA